jgi:uncharacterized glyoxalase superfamily protein PhnB
MPRAIGFYTRILGFQLCWHSPNDGGGENAMLQAGATELLLSTGAHLGGQPEFTGTLYFQMDGVREFYDRVQEHVEIVWPLEEMEYGQREFGLHDCDGYTLAFSEEIHPQERSN